MNVIRFQAEGECHKDLPSVWVRMFGAAHYHVSSEEFLVANTGLKVTHSSIHADAVHVYECITLLLQALLTA